MIIILSCLLIRSLISQKQLIEKAYPLCSSSVSTKKKRENIFPLRKISKNVLTKKKIHCVKDRRRKLGGKFAQRKMIEQDKLAFELNENLFISMQASVFSSKHI